ncbi:hypothetical protein [Dyella subtropica]|uniref:hypothetical protein n=1 Tax=Dyella subtropica TaxID=2992127 RepID=UPI0022544218|nr:hypothetical protein [Dyella subtropica]
MSHRSLGLFEQDTQGRHFGCKNHVNADAAHNFIRTFTVTPASVHDSQRIDVSLNITQKGWPRYGGSAYRSEATAQRCKDRDLQDRTMHRAQLNSMNKH